MSDDAVPGRLPSLTGLRAAAAALVFVSHVRWLFPTTPLFEIAGHEINIRAFMQQGHVGVSFFFLLSGFVLHWSRRGAADATFRRRRFARIYPLYVCVWAAWIALAAAGVLTGSTPFAAAASLVLVQAWIPVESVFFGVNPPAWSLSCEVFFYAMFPFVAPRVAKASERALPRLVLVLGAVAVFLPIALVVLAGRNGRDATYWFAYVFPPFRFIEFVIGVALAEIVARGRWRNVPMRWALLAFAAAYLIAGRSPRVISGSAVTLVPLVLVLLAAAGRDLRGDPSIWRRRTLLHLGAVSYAVYLVQYAVIEPFRTEWPSGAETIPAGLALALVCLGVTLVVAEVGHHLIERPAEAKLRRRWRVPDDRGGAAHGHGVGAGPPSG